MCGWWVVRAALTLSASPQKNTARPCSPGRCSIGFAPCLCEPQDRLAQRDPSEAVSTPAVRTAHIEVMQRHTVQPERACWMQWGMGRPEASVGASRATTSVRMWLLKAGRSQMVAAAAPAHPARAGGLSRAWAAPAAHLRRPDPSASRPSP